MNEETAKQIFFYCEPRPGAALADEVDLLQFAEKILAVESPLIAKREHERCVEIVSNLNREVGKVLERLSPSGS
jgi:hypothetical protein